MPIEFPHLCYKCPGPHPARDGGKSYDLKQVCDEDQLEGALKSGWHATYAEASGLVQKQDEPVDDISPPSREEIEQKATELGIKFDGRTSDKKLLKQIEEAIKCRGQSAN